MNSDANRFGNGDAVRVSLQWVWSSDKSRMICQLLFQGQFAFELDPQRSYRLAFAMKDTKYYQEWKSFEVYDSALISNHKICKTTTFS